MRHRTQRIRFHRYVSLILIGLLLTPSLAAASSDSGSPSCLAEAEARLRGNEWVRLTMRDGRTIEGYLNSIDPAGRSLNLANSRSLDAIVESFESPELQRIQYHRKGTFNPLGITFGFFGGMAIGAIVGSFSQAGSTDSGLIAVSMVAGALGGLVVGIVVPPLIPRTKTIECE